MMNSMVDPNIKVVHTHGVKSPVFLYNEVDKHAGPIELKTTYINYLPRPVTVVERDNLKHTVPPIDCFGVRNFIIRKEIIIRHPTVQEIRRVLSTYNNGENTTLTIIKETLLEQSKNQCFTGVKIFIDYPILIDTFRENDGTIYCNITDKVFSVLPYDNVPAHPYAIDSVNRLELQEITGYLDPHSPTVKIELVDNEHRVSRRFISLLGKVREIKSKQDSGRKSGVYLNTVEKDGLKEEGYSIVQTHYSLDVIEEQLGIFKTEEEAESAGDVKTYRKENVTLLEHENIRLSRFAEKEKIENKIKEDSLKLQDLERQLRVKEEEMNQKIALEEVRDGKERESLERKSEYEKRAYERKDKYEEKSTFMKIIPESLKFLLAIATIIGGLFVTYKKMSAT